MQKSMSRGQGSKVSKHVAGVGGIAGKQYSTITEENRYGVIAKSYSVALPLNSYSQAS